MRYELTDEFTQLPEGNDLLAQNLSSAATIEISTEAEKNSGVLLYPQRKAKVPAGSFARARNTGYGTCILAVYPLAGENGGGGGTGTGIEFATNEEVQEMIDTALHKTPAEDAEKETDNGDGFATDDEVREMMRKVLGK